MTDIVKGMRDAYNGAWISIPNDDEIEVGQLKAMRAALMWLADNVRDEIGLDPGYCDECKDNKKLFREILASDGEEKAAGGSTREDEPGAGATPQHIPAADRIEALEGEIKQLEADRAHGLAWMRKAEVAEARAKWLQAVLARIANLDPSQEPWACAIARNALEDDKQ